MVCVELDWTCCLSFTVQLEIDQQGERLNIYTLTSGQHSSHHGKQPEIWLIADQWNPRGQVGRTNKVILPHVTHFHSIWKKYTLEKRICLNDWLKFPWVICSNWVHAWSTSFIICHFLLHHSRHNTNAWSDPPLFNERLRNWLAFPRCARVNSSKLRKYTLYK